HETLLGIQIAAFVVGLGEALTDGAETETADITGLSARGMVGMAVVGLPLGGILYEIYPATPFLFEVLAFAVAALFALLVLRPVVPADIDEDEPAPGPVTMPGTGLITISAALAAIATSAVLGVLVLFALDDLGLGAPAFGGLLAGLALCTAAGGFVAPEVGTALGLKPGLIVAAAVAAAGYATASQVADPVRPLAGAMALGVAAGAGMIVAVLSRALLQRNAGRSVAGPVLQRFHLAVWSAIPVGALAGGWVASQRSVHEVLLWSTAAWAGAAVCAALARPAKKSSEFV
ncbi:MAG: Antibiotic efflux protein, partial [Actinomycetia bacterium]|nr:Antibiotic efflux protein [Actinomycetes bacterium]